MDGGEDQEGEAVMTWLEAWDEAARAYFGEPCANARRLLNVARDLPSWAPECRWSPAREAWLVYQDEGETDVGRAAVALTYCIQDLKDNRPR